MKVLKNKNQIKAIAMACLVAVSFTACNQNQDNSNNEDEIIVAEEVQEAPAFSDPQIAAIVVVANQIDVDYGKIALEKSQNEEVLNFANTMIKDHEQIIQSASDLCGQLGVVPEENDFTETLLNGQKDVLASFEGLGGADFDKAYIENEAAYHDAVINAVKDILIPQTENEQLKQALIDVTPLLEHHLEMAKMAQGKINNN